MQRNNPVPWLAAMLLVSALTGFVADGRVGPPPLEAQSACGQYNGKLCKFKCDAHCPDGSCCEASYYYYNTPAEET